MSPLSMSSWWRRAVVAAPLLVLVGVIVWLMASAAHEPTQLRLTSATDAAVELSDGNVVEGYAGLALPDGAVIRTGSAGSAIAGDVMLGPNEVGVVKEGELARTEGPADGDG